MADLRARIDVALTTAKAQSLGVFVVADGLGAVYEKNADVALLPASTQKLYVGGAALLRLGPEYRFTTEVRASVLVGADGVLQGDLVLRGSGDPSFGAGQLTVLAAALAKAGVKSVTGALVIDDSHFDDQRTGQGWKPSFSPGESGLLDAFSIDGNHIVSIDPGLTNLARFRSALLRKGLTVTGADRRGALPNGGPVLAAVRSEPLSVLVTHMLKKSDNTYAELLLKELGAVEGQGSSPLGVVAVAREFSRLGVPIPQQVDGSGLSSLNRSTARLQVRWLEKLAASAVGPELRAALPIACVDGTLRSRMCATAAEAKVQAKTGALDYVIGITGFVPTASGRTATFSMLLNGVPSNARARAAVDQALSAIAASRI